jgi:hypothetical protein
MGNQGVLLKFILLLYVQVSFGIIPIVQIGAGFLYLFFCM